MPIKYDEDVASIPNIEQSGGMFGAAKRKIASADAANRARTKLQEFGIPDAMQSRPRSAAMPQVVPNTMQSSVRDIGMPAQDSIISSGNTPRLSNRDRQATLDLNAFDKDLAVSGQEQEVGGYTVSGMTSGELERFSRDPARPATRAERGLTRVGANNSGQGYSPNYAKSWNQIKDREAGGSPLDRAKAIMGPMQIDTSGFSGNAAKARANTQRINYQTKLAGLAEGFDKTEAQEEGATIRSALDAMGDAEARSQASRLAGIKEAGMDRRLSATQAFAKTKQALDRKAPQKGNFKRVPDIDPISGKPLSTGRFYNADTGEWKDEPAAAQAPQDATSDFFSNYK